MWILLPLCILFSVSFLPSAAQAEDPVIPETVEAPVPSSEMEDDFSSAEQAEDHSPPANVSKRVIIRRKDEGTRARERFKAETLPKSQYQLNGRPLSIDPD